jgi:hypothetical protein
MLQLFFQIPDRSTATRRGRFHFKKTSLHDAETLLFSTVNFHDAETPLFSTVNFHDAETPLFSTGDLHAAETPLVNPLDLLLRQTATILHFLLFFVARTPLSSIRPSSPLLKHQNHTFFPPHHGSTTFFISSSSFVDKTTSSSNCFAFPLPMLQHHFSALLNFSPYAETPLFNTFSSHSQNTTVHHFFTIHH